MSITNSGVWETQTQFLASPVADLRNLGPENPKKMDISTLHQSICEMECLLSKAPMAPGKESEEYNLIARNLHEIDCGYCPSPATSPFSLNTEEDVYSHNPNILSLQQSESSSPRSGACSPPTSQGLDRNSIVSSPRHDVLDCLSEPGMDTGANYNPPHITSPISRRILHASTNTKPNISLTASTSGSLTPSKSPFREDCSAKKTSRASSFENNINSPLKNVSKRLEFQI